MQIAILGYSGSGKSTLAKYCSSYYEIPLLYLDKVQFQENWKERNKEEAISIVTEFMKQESWVMDGNYTGFLQKERLELANQIIYLKFSRFSCLYRVLKRHFQNRNRTRESMAEGCHEKIDLEFIWWVFYKGRDKAKRKYYENVIHQYQEKVVVLNNQKELTAFINSRRPLPALF